MSTRGTKSILVTGCRGQVGQELLIRGAAQGLSLIGLDQPDIDIVDAGSVQTALDTYAPNLIINAAAYTAVDKAESESELAFAVNAEGARNLAHACAGAHIPLFHISTDYVFDGTRTRPYTEDNPVAPLGVYGSSKAEGDEAVRGALTSHIILRTAWVYSPFGGNFVKTMLRLANERDELKIVDDQHGCPTAAQDIADTLLTMAKIYFDTPEDMADKWGTYHFCSGPETTWRRFAEAIIDGSVSRGGRRVAVTPITTVDYPTPARRPANSVLDCSKIKTAFKIEPREWHVALDETLAQLLATDRKREKLS